MMTIDIDIFFFVNWDICPSVLFLTALYPYTFHHSYGGIEFIQLFVSNGHWNLNTNIIFYH